MLNSNVYSLDDKLPEEGQELRVYVEEWDKGYWLDRKVLYYESTGLFVDISNKRRIYGVTKWREWE